MRKVLLTALIVLPAVLFSFQQSVRLGWGGLRPEYYYPMNVLNWTGTGVLLPVIGLDAEIRSYGTFYFLSFTSYDFKLTLRYLWSGTTLGPFRWENRFLAGAGWFLMLRKEAAGSGGFYPAAGIQSEIYWSGFRFRLELATRWYSDGFSVGIIPEIGWDGEWFGVFIRTEPEWTTLYTFRNGEWNWNNLAGFAFHF